MAPPSLALARCTRPTATGGSALLLLATLLALPAPALAQTTTVNDFASSWSALGSASISGGNTLTLTTTAREAQTAAAWAPYCMSPSAAFTVAFDLEVGPFSEPLTLGRYAGLAFVLQSDPRFRDALQTPTDFPIGNGWSGSPSGIAGPAVGLSLSSLAFEDGGNEMRGQWQFTASSPTDSPTPLAPSTPYLSLGPVASVATRITITYEPTNGLLTATTAAGATHAVNIGLLAAFGSRPMYFGFTASKGAGEGDGLRIRVTSLSYTTAGLGTQCGPSLPGGPAYSGLNAWSLQGSAETSSDGVIVTMGALIRGTGAAWSPSCLTSSTSFRATFTARYSTVLLGGESNGPGADGAWAFVLQADPRGRQALGPYPDSLAVGLVNGVGQSLEGPLSIKPSLSFRMAPRLGWGNTGMDGSWVSSLGSSQQSKIHTSGEGSDRTFTIVYDAGSKTLTATHTGTGESVSTFADLQYLFGSSPIVFGFTAGSGDEYWANRVSLTITSFDLTTSVSLDACPTPAQPSPTPAPASPGQIISEGLSGWSRVGSAGLYYGGDEAAVVDLTTDSWRQAGAVWAPFCVDVTNDFTVSFTIRLSNQRTSAYPYPSAGWAFVIHNDPRGRGAIGGEGRGYGVGITDGSVQTDATPAAGIMNVVALLVNTAGAEHSASWGSGGQGVNGGGPVTSLQVTPGSTGTDPPRGSCCPNCCLDVTVRFDRSEARLTAETAGTTVTQNAVILERMLGSSAGYIGFTAGNGGNAAWAHTITNVRVARSQVACPAPLLPSPTPAPAGPNQGISETLRGWSRVGSAGVYYGGDGSDAVDLTGDGYGQAGAVWAPFCVGVTSDFTVSFTVRLSNQRTYLDTQYLSSGWAFVIHNDPRARSALGGPGGGYGVGITDGSPWSDTSSAPGITNVVALQVNTAGAQHSASWGSGRQGVFGVSGGGSVYGLQATPGSTATEPPRGPCCAYCCLDVTVRYDRAAARLTAETADRTVTQDGIYLEQVLGATNGYIGFTAGNGDNMAWAHTVTNVRVAAQSQGGCPISGGGGNWCPPGQYRVCDAQGVFCYCTSGGGGGGSGGGASGGGSTAVSIRWDLLLGFGKLLLTFLEQLWKAVTGGQGAGRGL